MTLEKYIKKNYKGGNNLFDVIYKYVEKYMLSDADTDLIESLGFDFEDFIIEEDIVTVEDLLFYRGGFDNEK